MTTLKLDIDEYKAFVELIKEDNRRFVCNTKFENRILNLVLNNLLKRLAKKFIDHTTAKKHIKFKLDVFEVHVLHEFLVNQRSVAPPYTYSLIVTIVLQLNPLIID